MSENKQSFVKVWVHIKLLVFIYLSYLACKECVLLINVYIGKVICLVLFRLALVESTNPHTAVHWNEPYNTYAFILPSGMGSSAHWNALFNNHTSIHLHTFILHSYTKSIPKSVSSVRISSGRSMKEKKILTCNCKLPYAINMLK